MSTFIVHSWLPAPFLESMIENRIPAVGIAKYAKPDDAIVHDQALVSSHPCPVVAKRRKWMKMGAAALSACVSCPVISSSEHPHNDQIVQPSEHPLAAVTKLIEVLT